MVIGYHVETTQEDSELDKQLDNLRFLCTTSSGFNEQKYNCYKEKLLTGYSSEKIEDDTELEKEEMMIPVNLPSVSMVGGPKDTPWPMKCHDVRHTSQSPYSTVHIDGLEKWRVGGTDGWVEGGPAIDSDGTIYFGDFDRYLYALYPDGTEKWRYKTGGWISSAPAIAKDDIIYFGSWDTKLYAFNPNGTLKWKIGTGGSIASSPAIGEDGTIYLGHLDNSICAFNPNGTLKWSYTTGYKIASDPAIGDDGTIYIGSGDSYLYAMYPNGTLRWRFKTGDEIHSHPSIADDGTIYIGSNDDYLYAVFPDGTLKWKTKTDWGIYNSASIAEDGTIYVGDEKLYAIYPNNGTKKWTLNLGTQRWIGHSSPAISSEGTIYIGTKIGNGNGGEIIAINPDGTEQWRKKIGPWVDSSPCIAEDGTVYIGSSGWGYLHAFGPVESNEPPGTPTISGETNGWAGRDYWYGFRAVDPDRNPIKFNIEWGDGTSTGWTSERASGEKCYYEHAWSEQDEYTIRCKAKDVMGEESNWAELTVSMPRSREVQQMSFLCLLEQFPMLREVLLRLINL
jgi:outer membrane protein assembly factor BamB